MNFKMIAVAVVCAVTVQLHAFVGLTNVVLKSVIVQANGQIVAAGTATVAGVTQGFLMRYNTSGAFDSTFNSGIPVTQIVGDNTSFNGVFQQADGKLVVAGSTNMTTNPQYLVMRYNSDGSLDTGFATQGILTGVLGNASALNAIAQQSDGKLVIGGTETTAALSPVTRFFLIRLTTAGAFDSTFGTSGQVFSSNSNAAVINSVLIQSDGKIIAAGTTLQSQGVVIRYTSAGALDTTFGSSGVAIVNNGSVSNCNAAVLQSDGKIVGGGYSDANFGLFRLTSAGVLDTTYGNAANGKVTTAFTYPAVITSLVQATGVFAVGYTDSGLALAHYTTGGVLDTTFGSSSSGQMTAQVGPISRALSATLESNSQILVAGSSTPNLFLTRYSYTGLLDTSFGNSGVAMNPPTCSLVPCAYGQIYNVTQQDPANDQFINFDSAGQLLNVGFTAPSTQITVNQAGTYLLRFIFQVAEPSTIQVQQNGNVVANATYNSQGSTAVGEAIITAAVGDVLKFYNVSGTDLFFQTGAVNANVTLERIA